MANLTAIDGPRQPAANGQPPAKLVILLHGYGADGNDLIGLAPYWARALPDTAFISPHAPEPCGMQPAGRQWFSIGSFSADERLRGAEKAAPVLDAFIDQELERHGLDDSRLALVGFSQGTMMALHVGLRRQRPCAGIVGFSGALVAPERLPDEITARPPVLLIHGDADDLLPVESLFQATQGLAAAAVNAEWHVSANCGHSIAQDGLELGGQFLQRALTGQLATTT
ncbi:MAG: prolyl oligopeptidase family serine peptidase [Alphaproteobacteria bacterium]